MVEARQCFRAAILRLVQIVPANDISPSVVVWGRPSGTLSIDYRYKNTYMYL
jgi:hypothetical protein